jgi:hypothetical protein
MGTHDDTNGAEPQNEFLSGFKLNVISTDKEKQPSSVPQSGKNDAGAGSKKLSLSSQNVDPFEKKDDEGLVRKLKTRFMGKESGTGDTRQKVMMVLIPILFIIMVFMFRQVLKKTPEKAAGQTGNSKKTVSVNTSSNKDIDWQIPEPLPATMRDPVKLRENTPEITIQNTTPVEPEEEKISVKSIVYSSDKPSVVINNKIVYSNQTVNGVTVVEIQRDHVVLEKDGKRWTQTISVETSPEKKDAHVPEKAGSEADSGVEK